jgi:hypothetical protein
MTATHLAEEWMTRAGRDMSGSRFGACPLPEPTDLQYKSIDQVDIVDIHFLS